MDSIVGCCEIKIRKKNCRSCLTYATPRGVKRRWGPTHVASEFQGGGRQSKGLQGGCQGSVRGKVSKGVALQGFQVRPWWIGSKSGLHEPWLQRRHVTRLGCRDSYW